VFTSDPFFAFRSELLAELALRHAVPAITQSRDFAIAGGLMSYGGDFVQSHRQAGVYVGRILAGARPSDLPVQQITKLELLVNLRTARSFGIAVPLSVLGRADEVIE
jgi:putative ABC transport system substrate-binding protein